MIHRRKGKKTMNSSDKNSRNKGKQLKALLRLIGYMFKLYKFHFIAVLVFILLSSLSMVVGTMYTKQLIDGYITPNIGNPNIDFAPLVKIILSMGAAYLTGMISTYLYERLMIVAAQGTLKTLRDDVFSHMEKLPIKYFDTHAHGDIMSVYSSDIDTLRNMITESLAQIISAIITVVSVLTSMFILSVPLTIFTLVMVILTISVTRNISGKSGKNFKNQQENIGAVNGYIEEMLEGLKVVKVFSYEEEAKDKFDILNEKLFESSNNANKYGNILGPVVGNLGNINFVLTASIGSFLAISNIGGFTLGGLASFLQFTRTLNQPISQTAMQINSVLLAAAGAQRVFQILDEKPEFDEGYVKLVNAGTDENGNIKEVDKHTGMWAWKHPHEDGTVSYERLLGDVVFENVDFGYNESKIILHDINLYAKPGEKIAFVGATGAGKTTITKLLFRFYDLQGGEILIDNQNIANVTQNSLRENISMIPQEPVLFHRSIRENIAYGKPNATEQEIIAASKMARCHEFI